MESRAQHGVEHRVAAAEQHVELVSRRSHDVDDARFDGGLRHHPRKVTVELVRLARRHDADVNAGRLELLGRHPAVAAVVAKAGEHHGARDVAQAQDLLCRGTSRTVHELGYAHAGIRKARLDGLDVLNVQ